MDRNSILRKYSRYLLIIFNFSFVFTGVLIISVGASVKTYYYEYDSFLDHEYIYASYLLIIIGAIIFCVAFFGCLGVLEDNVCMTSSSSTILLGICILEAIFGIGGLVLKHRTEDLVDDKLMTKTMKEYTPYNQTDITILWDQLQMNFYCCGVNNFSDWKNVPALHGNIPFSCCDVPAGTLTNFTCTPASQTLHHKGCLEPFGNYIEGRATSFESVSLTLGIIQLLVFLLFCYSFKQIRRDYETI